MEWFRQKKNWELGNFIMCTPMLQALSEMRGHPIPVFFETKKLIPLFQDAQFIKILKEKPKNKPFFDSEYPRKFIKQGETNSACLFRIFCTDKGYKGSMPSTYIDNKITHKLDKETDKKYIAVFHGCLNVGSNAFYQKDLKEPTRIKMLEIVLASGCCPVLLGSPQDLNVFWKPVLKKVKSPVIKNYLGELNLRDSVSVLKQCDAFISNDTGLYHCAGALGVKGLVLWRKTDFHRNLSTFNGIKYGASQKGKVDHYVKYMQDFLSENNF